MKFLDGLMAQFEVIHALCLRETRTRFGQHRMGFMWALIEPTLFILSFYLVFKVAGREAPVGMTLFSFVATGVIPFLIFTNTVTQVSQAINANKALLFYPQVNPLDVVLARVFLEFVTHIGVFIILMGGESLYLQQWTISDPLLIAFGFLLASLLGGGLGLIFCGLGQFSNAIDRAQGTLMRPFFWVSGIFFTAAGLPPAVRESLLYNPTLQVAELIRAGYFERYDDRYADCGYILMWSVALLIVGLALERVVRRKIEVA